MKRTKLTITAMGLLLFVQAAQAFWTPAKRLTWTSGYSGGQAIAIDSNDHVHIVWLDETPGNAEVYYKRSTDEGTTWSTAKRLTWTLNHSSDPRIAVDSSDAIHVVWQEQDDSGQGAEVYYKKSTDGGTTWSVAQRLTWTSGTSYGPSVAAVSALPSVIWERYVAGNAELYHKRSTDGGTTWSAVQRLTWTSGLSTDPVIAADPGNDIHIAWYDDTSGGSEIYHKKSTDGGATWSAAKRLTWSPDSPDFPAIAADSSNSVHVVWRGNTPANYEILYKRSPDAGTTWSAAERLTWTPGGSWDPAIGVDSGDAIHLVWGDDTPGNFEIYAKKSANGGATWTAAQRLTWTSGHSGMPAVAIDTSNIVHVVWYDYTPGNSEIYYLKGN
jgi:hypothetical protein